MAHGKRSTETVGVISHHSRKTRGPGRAGAGRAGGSQASAEARPAGAERQPGVCSRPWHRGGRADLLRVPPAKAGAAGSSLPMTQPPASPSGRRLCRPCPPGARLAARKGGVPWAGGDRTRPPGSPPAAPDSGPGSLTFGGGESRVSAPLPPQPSVKAIPLGSLAIVSQEQLFGLSDARALHSSEQAAGLGAT